MGIMVWVQDKVQVRDLIRCWERGKVDRVVRERRQGYGCGCTYVRQGLRVFAVKTLRTVGEGWERRCGISRTWGTRMGRCQRSRMESSFITMGVD